MRDIELYIGNSRVDFQQTPEILYTYQADELTNPTVVKNSFSKTLTIKGTPGNNAIFGHLWSIERVQLAGGAGDGVHFNASKKVPFQLFCGSDLYETGYVKLEEVRMNGGDTEYDITMYGGLGDFFYNLSTDADGNQLKLNDLKFPYDLGFEYNIDTVKAAWDSLPTKTDNKWRHINFIPAYNGLPDDFSSDRIIIDTEGTNLTTSTREDGRTYTTRDGFVLANLPREMTEWEVRDLRSYLQRPCIRMKSIIEACCDDTVNGGYTVDLDGDFFSEDNPYWEDTWLTLPMASQLEYTSEEQALTGSTLVAGSPYGSATGEMYQDLTFDVGEFSQTAPSSITVRMNIGIGLSGDRYTSYVWFWNNNGNSYHSNWWNMGSLAVQLIAMNGDTVVGASSVHNLTTVIRHNGSTWYGDDNDYSGGRLFSPYMAQSKRNYYGYFHNGMWCAENSTSPQSHTFTIANLNSNVTSLRVCYYWQASKDKIKKDGQNRVYNKTKDVSWTNRDYTSYEVAVSRMDAEITYQSIGAVLGEMIGRTGTRITQDLLLNTEATPCDYLLSYCKMFGLYFSKDMDSNTIHIRTRENQYVNDGVIDLTGLIDYGQDITVTPLTFDTKWVEFSQEADETQFYDQYMASRGISYGCKVLDTGYEFNSEKKRLLEGNVIRSGIEGLERSTYFTCYNNDSRARPWFVKGMTYSLYNGEDTVEMNGSGYNVGKEYGLNDKSTLKYYDLFPKMQFHDDENGPVDGNNCLVFYSGMKSVRNRSVPLDYILSDDTVWQSQLNGGEACWLMTDREKVGGRRICYVLDRIPVFERYLTGNGGTKAMYSLDFGTPQELFVPDYSVTEDVNIYSRYWESYLTDLYSVDNRILTCFVRLDSNPNPEWLRKFFWFENSIWRINRIIDWNPASYGTTQIEFIKVQNMGEYTTRPVYPDRPTATGFISDKYLIVWNGDSATLTVTVPAGKEWRIICPNQGIVFSRTSGTGSGTVTATISANNNQTDRNFNISLVLDDAQQYGMTITQEWQNMAQLEVSPSSILAGYQGGDYGVEYIWRNQGKLTVTGASVSGGIRATAEPGETGNGGTITLSANTGETVLRGTVTFVGNGVSGTVGIDQAPQSVSFPGTGGSRTLTFQYNTPNVVARPYWIDFSIDGGSVTLTAEASLQEAARTGDLVIYNGSEQAVVKMEQDGGTPPEPATDVPKVSPTNLYFDRDGQPLQYVMVLIGNTWTVERDGWIETNITGGTEWSVMAVSCQENTGASRTGHIYVTDAADGQKYTVNVMQSGPSAQKHFSVSPERISAPAAGGEFTITVNYDGREGDVVTVSADSGITVSQVAWTGDTGQTTVTVPANPSYSGRSFTVNFACSAGSASTVVSQAGIDEEITLDDYDKIISNTGGSEYVVVTANIAWTAVTSEEWLAVIPTSGADGSIRVTVIAEENDTEYDRTGYVDFSSIESGALLARLKVTQSAVDEVIKVIPSSIRFASTGGTTFITINSNVNWTIEDA